MEVANNQSDRQICSPEQSVKVWLVPETAQEERYREPVTGGNQRSPS